MNKIYAIVLFGSTSIFSAFLVVLAVLRINSGKFGIEYAISTFGVIVMAWWATGLMVKDLK